MQNLFPTSSTSGPPAGMSMSQYCLTLVIEPPVQGLSPGLLPGLRACWAKPLPHHLDHRAAGSLSYVRPEWASALRQQQAEAEEAEALMSSKVHWVVASIAVPGEVPGEDSVLRGLDSARHMHGMVSCITRDNIIHRDIGRNGEPPDRGLSALQLIPILSPFRPA